MSFRVKKAFTLIELIIVLIILVSSYFLVFSSSNFTIKEEKTKLSLENLKEVLLKNFVFEKSLSFFCIEDEFTCFVKVDGKLNKDFEIKNFFTTIPEIYKYSKKEEKLEFMPNKIDEISYDTIFEYKINSDFKANEFILDTLEDRVYVFNAIFEKPKTYESLSEVYDTFVSNELEVRDAF